MSAVIATMLELNWSFEGTCKWIDGEGTILQAEPDAIRSDTDWAAFYGAVDASVSRQLWEKAAQHRNGLGLQEGADFVQIRKHFNRLKTVGNTQ